MANCMIIEGKVYDTIALAKDHPGGELFVLQANNTDGTALFNSSHRRAFPHAKYAHCLSKVPAQESIEQLNLDWKNYWELCDRIKSVIPNGGFAPFHYFVKVAVLLALAMGFDIYMTFVERSYLLSGLAGFVFGLIGLNIQHDANHGAVSRNPMVNRVLGFSQDYIGGNALGWMVSHNVVHHVMCNDVARDHDLDLGAIRLKQSTPRAFYHSLQHIYFVLLECAFSPAHISYNISLCLSQLRKDNGVLGPFWATHRMLMGILAVRVISALIAAPSWTTVWQLNFMYMVGGLYLSFFFLLSHNFEDVKKEGINATKGDFVYNQAVTSSNVGGAWLAHLNGGLNYQIEHHLFPRIHHSNYATMSPIVKKFCKEKNIAYVHFPTVWANFVSTSNHLWEMARA
jgi:fatty acid desaturase (delta-4 desaturase)